MTEAMTVDHSAESPEHVNVTIDPLTRASTDEPRPPRQTTARQNIPASPAKTISLSVCICQPSYVAYVAYV